MKQDGDVTNRRLSLLAAAALVISALTFSGCGADDDSPENALRISATGTVNGIGVGSTAAEVKKAFGEPGKISNEYPADPLDAPPDVDHKWSEISGPYHYGPGGPPDKVQRTLFYDDISFYTVLGKVIGYLITGEGATTSEGLKIGDSLEKTQEIYPDAACEGDSSSDTSSVREAHCDIDLSGIGLNVTDDPIESFTVGADWVRSRRFAK